jgi:hypothetical protein
MRSQQRPGEKSTRQRFLQLYPSDSFMRAAFPQGLFARSVVLAPRAKEEWMKTIQLNIRSIWLGAPSFTLMRFRVQGRPFPG